MDTRKMKETQETIAETVEILKKVIYDGFLNILEQDKACLDMVLRLTFMIDNWEDLAEPSCDCDCDCEYEEAEEEIQDLKDQLIKALSELAEERKPKYTFSYGSTPFTWTSGLASSGSCNMDSSCCSCGSTE